MKFKTLYNAQDFPWQKEKNTQPSKTVPDDAMSLTEIKKRYAHGLPVNGKVAVYEGDNSDLPDLRGLDLSQIHDIIEDKKAEIKEIGERVAKRRQDAAHARLKKQLQEQAAQEADELAQLERLKKKFEKPDSTNNP